MLLPSSTRRPAVLSPVQNLREEKQAYEKELMNLRNRYEEETSHFRETQSRALEELSKKHRAALENTQSSAEKEKNRLLAVSVLSSLTHTRARTNTEKRGKVHRSSYP